LSELISRLRTKNSSGEVWRMKENSWNIFKGDISRNIFQDLPLISTDL
jgi:hypothetical protein